jgi:hypothetical protein
MIEEISAVTLGTHEKLAQATDSNFRASRLGLPQSPAVSY